MKIDLSKIRIDGGTQPRAELDEATVVQYGEELHGGAKFPPVEIFFDGESYWLADGFHRIAAAKQIGWKEIEAEIHQGDRRAAVLYSVGANFGHGIRRTNADKRRAVLTLLADAEWCKWSDRVIATHARVHPTFVLRLRRDSAGADNQHLARMGQDGKTYSVPGPRLDDLAAASIQDLPVFDDRAQVRELAALRPEAQRRAATLLETGEARTVRAAIARSKLEPSNPEACPPSPKQPSAGPCPLCTLPANPTGPEVDAVITKLESLLSCFRGLRGMGAGAA